MFLIEVTLVALCDDLLHEIWDWKWLGLKLGISEGFLKEIEHNYPQLQDRKRETLSKWLQIDEYPSWSTLLNALVHIHQRHLARTIAEKCGKIFCLNYTGSKLKRLFTFNVVGIPIPECDTSYERTSVAIPDDTTMVSTVCLNTLS